MSSSISNTTTIMWNGWQRKLPGRCHFQICMCFGMRFACKTMALWGRGNRERDYYTRDGRDMWCDGKEVKFNMTG